MNANTKCNLYRLIIILFPLLILLVVIFDESPKKTDNHEIEENVEQIEYGDKLKHQIDYLSQVKVSAQSLLDRKENAVWAAFALYITGLVFFYSYQKKLQKLSCIQKFLISLLLIITAISVFAFMHNIHQSMIRRLVHALPRYCF